ncbi:MAG: hypothetical protein IJM62_02495, partial [Lachnospiraceae bacterium]|nr:hypothetical protein [Lachnospiraceae bacterium]
YSNIYALDQSVFTGELLNWIARNAGRRNLSKLIAKKASEGASFKELVSVLESKCVLFERKDIEDLCRTIDDMEHQNPLQVKRAKGGNLLRYGHYTDAVSMYLGILDELKRRQDTEEDLPSGFEASVYHDLGTAFTRLLDFRSAAAAFKSAYEQGLDNSELKYHIFCLKALNDVKAIKDVMATYDLSEETVKAMIDEYNEASELPARTIMGISADQKAYIDRVKDIYRNA